MNIQDIDINLLVPYENNAKLHPDWQIDAISESIKLSGFDVPLVVVPQGDKFLIVKGHGRRLAGLKMGLTQLPCYISPLSADAAIKAARVLDNKTNESGYDLQLLVAELEEIAQADSSLFTGYDDQEYEELIEQLSESATNELNQLIDGEGDLEDSESSPEPNDIFPSSNEWDIPDLDLNMQPDTTDIDWLKWGVQQRTATHDGGIHFYTDDYKFSAVWDKPDDLLETGCSVVIEPNFSTWANMPRALAMTDIYKKRWLARYWQKKGVRVWVDVNTSPHLHDLNFLGVPKEWRYFATRYLASFDDGNVAGYDATMSDWHAIVDYTGTDECVLLVYGARPTTFQDAPRQWILQLEHSDFIRGNYG